MKRPLAWAAGACVLLAIWCWYALSALAEARGEHAAAVAANTAPRIEAPRPLSASDEKTAESQLARILGDRATAAGVRLSLTPTERTEPPGLIVLRLEARGPEAALRRFASAVENGPGPMIRLISWTMGANGGSGLRLSAEALATWLPATGEPAAGRPIRLAAPTAEIVPETRDLFAAEGSQDVRPRDQVAPELIGIAGRLPDAAMAMLRLPDGSTKSLAIGQTAGGWRVTAIAADRVRLAQGGVERVLVLPANPAQ